MLQLKTIFLQIFCVLFLFNCSSFAQMENGHDSRHIPKHKIKISIEKGEKGNEIVFKLTNEGNHIYHAYPVVSSYNKIFFITEEGKKIEHHIYVTAISVEVQPKEIKIYKRDITSIIRMYKLTDEKNLQIIWNVKGVESNSLIINQRN